MTESQPPLEMRAWDEEKLRDAFELFDADKDGEINADELQKVNTLTLLCRVKKVITLEAQFLKKNWKIWDDLEMYVEEKQIFILKKAINIFDDYLTDHEPTRNISYRRGAKRDDTDG